MMRDKQRAKPALNAGANGARVDKAGTQTTAVVDSVPLGKNQRGHTQTQAPQEPSATDSVGIEHEYKACPSEYRLLRFSPPAKCHHTQQAEYDGSQQIGRCGPYKAHGLQRFEFVHGRYVNPEVQPAPPV